MAQSTFITILAVLTAIAGAALVVMLVRRRHETRERSRRLAERELRTRDETLLPEGATTTPIEIVAEKRRTIDDYAIPVGFDAQAGSDEEVDIGKICPACGARYASHHRFCQRCGDSELAALN